MSRATLTTAPCEAMGTGARQLTLDCPHGTTTVVYAPGPVELGERELAMVALGKHRDEQPDCQCIARLWREHFGAELGQVIPARGSR